MDSRYDITLERWQAAQWAEQRENERSRARVRTALKIAARGLYYWHAPPEKS